MNPQKKQKAICRPEWPDNPQIGSRIYGNVVVPRYCKTTGPLTPGEAWLDLQRVVIMNDIRSIRDIGSKSPTGGFDIDDNLNVVRLEQLCTHWKWPAAKVLAFIAFLVASKVLYLREPDGSVWPAHVLLRPFDPNWMRQ